MVGYNQIICGDSEFELRKLESESIDLVVTSPPYDNIREYNNYKFDYSKLLNILKESARVLKYGGVMCVVIQDQKIDGAMSMTSFSMTVDLCRELEYLRLWQCCIYHRDGVPGLYKYMFKNEHEYIMIFIKQDKDNIHPKYFNKDILNIKTRYFGKMVGTTRRENDGTIKTIGNNATSNEYKCRGTVWKYSTVGQAENKNKLKIKHPATFPDKLAEDLIKCFSKDGDIVLDPFSGSGTVAFMAKLNERKYIAIDICKSYCDIAERRCKETLMELI